MADPTPSRGGLGAFDARFQRLEREAAELRKSSGTQRAQTVAKVVQMIDALPFVDMRSAEQAGFGLAEGWNTYATVTLPVPEGKRLLRVRADGIAAVLDQTSGGLTTANGRLVINGAVSREFPASKDAGARVVNNIITAAAVASGIDVSALSAVRVDFQLQPLNPAAFPAHVQNFAQLAVTGSFTIT